MARIRTGIAALAVLTSLAGWPTLLQAETQTATFSRCPSTAQQYNEVMKVLSVHTERARALAQENPLLLADVGFYEAELKATRQCMPAVATVAKLAR